MDSALIANRIINESVIHEYKLKTIKLYDRLYRITTVSHPAYIGILPPRKEGIRPRVAIFARKNTPYSYTARPDISSDSDILILQISGPGISPFQLINIYNEKGLEEDRE
jgi:hypothetical protein